MSQKGAENGMNIDPLKSHNYTVSPLELSRVADDSVQSGAAVQENNSERLQNTFQQQRSMNFSKQFQNHPKNYWTQQSQNTFIDDLQTQLASVKVQYDMLQQQFEDQQQQQQQVINQYKAEIQMMREQLQKLNAEKSMNSSIQEPRVAESQKITNIYSDEQIVTLKYQNSQLQELNNNFQKQINEQDQQIDALRIELQQVRLENGRLQQKVELNDQQLQTSLYQSTQTINMQHQIQHLTQSLQEAKTELFNKQSELDKLHQQITIITLQYDQLKEVQSKNEMQYNLKGSQHSLSTNTQIPYPSAMSTISQNMKPENVFQSINANPQQSRGLLMSSYAQDGIQKVNPKTTDIAISNRSQENASLGQIFRENNSDTLISQLQSNMTNNQYANYSLDTFKQSHSDLYKTQKLNYKNLTMKYKNTNPNTQQNGSLETNKIYAPIRLNYRSKSNPILAQHEKEQHNIMRQYLLENHSREQDSSESNLTPQYLTKQYFVDKNSNQTDRLSPELKVTPSLSSQFNKGRSPKNLNSVTSSSQPLSTNSLPSQSHYEWDERNDHGIISSIAVIAAVILGVGVYTYQFK